MSLASIPWLLTNSIISLLLSALSDLAFLAVSAWVKTPSEIVARSGTAATLPSADIEIVFWGVWFWKLFDTVWNLSMTVRSRNSARSKAIVCQSQDLMFVLVLVSMFFGLIADVSIPNKKEHLNVRMLCK